MTNSVDPAAFVEVNVYNDSNKLSVEEHKMYEPAAFVVLNSKTVWLGIAGQVPVAIRTVTVERAA